MNTLLLALLLTGQPPAPPPPRPAAPPPYHFDATERCSLSGVAEWDVYYAPDGRLHIDVWCLQEEPLDPHPDMDHSMATRCTDEYQRTTDYEFYADDAPDCPGLSVPPAVN